LKTYDIENVLIIGIDAAALAASAKRAGYTVFAVDYFGDVDLKGACKDSLSIVTQEAGESCGYLQESFSANDLLILTKKLLAEHRIDAVLLASGLEDSPQVVEELNKHASIVGNSPKAINRVRDKTRFFDDLKSLGIHRPETAKAENLLEGKRAAKDIGYPVLIKPPTSFGGAGVKQARSPRELEQAFHRIPQLSKEMLIQERISGVDASVSFLSTGKGAKVLAVNEQLLGTPEVGQREKFGYCGNVVPISRATELTGACGEIVRKIAEHYSLVGSNGIDIVISEDGIPYVIEVNPRFQGTSECVERVCGVNLVDAHMEACLEGKLSCVSGVRPRGFCVRLILYALHRSIVPDLRSFAELRDIPLPRAIIEEGEPLSSIVVKDETKISALRRAKRLARRIYKAVKANSITDQKT
jgi:predicted ATP-grasp superfamily ATP-dependent carboligase